MKQPLLPFITAFLFLIFTGATRAQLLTMPQESDSMYYRTDIALQHIDRCAYLYLEYDSLKSLPPAFNQLIHLRGITFKYCPKARWDSIFISLADLPQLQYLEISICRISALPENISLLRNIQTLVLNADLLRTLPSGILGCSRLTHIALAAESDMKWNDCAKRLDKMSWLESLDCSNEGWNQLPEAISKLEQLKEIRLANNSLLTLNDDFFKLDHLSSIDLSNNPTMNFEEVFDQLKQFPELEKLNLAANDIMEIPKTIGNLTHLTSLDLSANAITKLPNSFGNLAGLTYLNLGSGNSTMHTNAITKFNGFDKLVNLETLDMSGISMMKLPPFIKKLTKLRVLRVSWTNLTFLGEELRSCTQLERLIADHCMIPEIPAWIGEFSQLKELNLDANFFGWNVKKIVAIPASITQCTNLEILSLRDHVIKSLPEGFSSLAKLKRLDLRNNAITNLPDDFGKLGALKYLDLKANQLIALPASFSDLPQLRFLDISFNQNLDQAIATEVLSKTRSLQLLDVSYNKWSDTQLAALKNALPHTKVVALTLDKLPTPGTTNDEPPKNK